MKKVLVANRGEIAIRIIKACKELGIETVAVYSEADKESLHIMLADESYKIGEGSPAKSYLNMDNIIEVAKLTKCDAIHPGYGFLSESIKFRQLCEDEHLNFIGPSIENLICMGDKLQAKSIAKEAKVPVVFGCDTSIENVEELKSILKDMEFPIIMKASSGGGGKGIKVCCSLEEAVEKFSIIKKEAEISFGDDGVYLEQYIPRFKHIEVQILGDKHGNYVHLGERLCSIQRNMQKIIEESPAPFLDENLRSDICEAAVRLARKVGYVGVGTVEFIYDYQNQKYYFMEMNTRIQVEHPVTEMVFGFDLVKEQIKVADGEKLKVTQSDLITSGHAIECRINAENADLGFRPCVGKISLFIPPTGSPDIRVDTFIYSGYKIPPYYDSMLGKIIAHGRDREEAIKKMEVALKSTVIQGVETTLPFLEKILRDDVYRNGDYDNTYVARMLHMGEYGLSM